MNPESTEIFCPSIKNDYYPQRPKRKKTINSYNFARWYDFSYQAPHNSAIDYFKIRDKYFKKRSRAKLTIHYKLNYKLQPEKYYFALLLMYQPRREIGGLKNGCET